MNAMDEKFRREPGPIVSGPEKLHFWSNLALIPPIAWAVAITIFVCLQLLFWLFVFPNSDPEKIARMPIILRALLSTFAASILTVWALLVGFVYADAKRRGMRHVMWTLLAAFVPNAIGIILYFLLRDPLPSPCPKCSQLVRGSFAFCPHCGAELLRACRVCGKKLEPGWVNCAYCGAPTAQPTRAA